MKRALVCGAGVFIGGHLYNFRLRIEGVNKRLLFSPSYRFACGGV